MTATLASANLAPPLRPLAETAALFRQECTALDHLIEELYRDVELLREELAKKGDEIEEGRRKLAQRGAQLHRLTEAVTTWVDKYGQRPYFRQLDTVVTRDMEDEFLRVVNEWNGHRFPRTGSLVRRWLSGRIRRSVPLEDVFCAELAAITYQRMGLLGSERPVNWYDPGRFWSGDRLELSPGAVLGEEIEVLV